MSRILPKALALLSVPIAALLACSSSTPGNANCGPGEVYLDGQCRALCTTDLDCGSGEICIGQEVCRPGQRSNIPKIDTVDGDGTSIDTDERLRFAADNPTLGDLTANHLDGGFLITGENLEGASFDIVGAAATTPLTVIANTGTLAQLALPTDWTGDGEHELVAVNSAGSGTATVFLLRGEQGEQGSPDTAADILAKLVTLNGTGTGLDADTFDGLDSSGYLNDTTDRVDSDNIADGTLVDADISASAAIAASKIDRTGLDADLLDGMEPQEIVDQALEYRCFEVRNDNSSGGSRAAKIFDVPFDCLSPYNGGKGCWGEMMTFRGAGASIWSSPLRIQFVRSGSNWLVQATRGDASYGGRNISDSNTAIVNPTSDSGHCTLYTASGRKAAGDGFENLNLSGSGGSYCYLRLCESLLDSQQIP